MRYIYTYVDLGQICRKVPTSQIKNNIETRYIHHVAPNKTALKSFSEQVINFFVQLANC